MFENEDWRVIEEFPDYFVSNYGRIKHKDRNEARQVAVNKQGFPVILLTNKPDPTRYLRQVNKLVALAFLPEPQNTEYADFNSVWHIDGNLANCNVENLKWETRPHVLEWNDMHRRGKPKLKTPQVKNNNTGELYESAYHCGISEGILESEIVWRIERLAHSMFAENTRYRYVTASHPA